MAMYGMELCYRAREEENCRSCRREEPDAAGWRRTHPSHGAELTVLLEPVLRDGVMEVRGRNNAEEQ